MAAFKLLREAKVPILAGTDIGYPYSPLLHAELEIMVADGGFLPIEALAAATANTADALSFEGPWTYSIGYACRPAIGQRRSDEIDHGHAADRGGLGAGSEGGSRRVQVQDSGHEGAAAEGSGSAAAEAGKPGASVAFPIFLDEPDHYSSGLATLQVVVSETPVQLFGCRARQNSPTSDRKSAISQSRLLQMKDLRERK